MAVDKIDILLKEQWGIKPRKVIVLNSLGPNITMKIEANQATYILRGLLSDKKYFQNSLLIEDVLKRNSIPISDTVLNLNGEKVVYKGEVGWILKRFMRGETFTMNSLNEIEEAAKILANIHNINCEVNNFLYSSIHDPFHWLSNGSEEVKKIEQMDLDASLKMDLMKNVSSILNKLSLDMYIRCPRAIVHGDYHGNNLIFREGKVCSVIDMETIGISAKVIDFAEAIFLFGREHHGAYVFSTAAVNKFVEVYKSYHVLTSRELKYMEDILKLRFLPRADYLLALKKKGDNAMHLQATWSINVMESIEMFFRKFKIEL